MDTDRERIARVARRLANPDRFTQAIAAIDGVNAEDPNTIDVDGESVGYELWFSRELFSWVFRLDANASEALLLAARSQHIARWTSPRSDYPMDRPGYLKWRSDLKRYHAERTRALLESQGYGIEILDTVSALNEKRNLKSNPECQTLEDGLCLVFLEKQFARFQEKTDADKMVDILRKSWAKMSARGREAALGLPLGEREKALVARALSGD